jgi:hypothetical protein
VHTFLEEERVTTKNEEEIIHIKGDSRKLAVQSIDWVNEQMKTNRYIFSAWERAVNEQIGLVGQYIIDHFRNDFPENSQVAKARPRISPSIRDVYISPCPMCRRSMVPLTRITPEEFKLSVRLPAGTLSGKISRKMLGDCDHRVPIDSDSWAIVQNYQYILREFK